VSESQDEEPGTPRTDLADEIGKLVGAAQEWARRALPESAIGHGGPDCQWCPICQFANIVRGESPEVAERIAEAGTAIAAALKAVADAAVAKAQGGDPARRPAKRNRPMPPPRVQRIDLDDPREP
jgi:hypothetical protein